MPKFRKEFFTSLILKFDYFFLLQVGNLLLIYKKYLNSNNTP